MTISSLPPFEPQRAQGRAGGGDAPSPIEVMGFADLLAALAQHQASDQPASAPSSSLDDIGQRARLFNEDGFFQAVAAIGAPAANNPPPGGGAVARGPDAAAVAASAGAIPEAALPDETTPVARSTGQSAASRGEQPIGAPGAAVPVRTVTNPQAMPAAGPPQARFGREGAAPEVAPRAATKAAAPVVEAAARFALQVNGGEAAIVARVSGLTGEDRVRLRLEIADLLARYRFSLAGLRLNGRQERTSEV